MLAVPCKLSRAASFVYDRSMLSYRHAFHAGNHADVLKHIVLLECLSLLKRKEKGFLAIDTHAGAGAYELDAGYAAQNREWDDGIARVKAFSGLPRPPAVEAYLSFVSDYGRSNSGAYPGSPVLIAGSLRPQDRSVFCELHPTDFAALEARFSGDRLVRARRADGFAELKALLPPPTRRGLVFMDPSFELAEDYRKAADAISDAIKRFAGCVVVLWHPILDRAEARALPELLDGLGAEKTLRAELRIADSRPGERGMTGSGLYIVNPPWTLSASLRETLPFLSQALGSTASEATLLIDRDSPAT